MRRLIRLILPVTFALFLFALSAIGCAQESNVAVPSTTAISAATGIPPPGSPETASATAQPSTIPPATSDTLPVEIPTPTAPAVPSLPSNSSDPVVLAAGDIAVCGTNSDEATARLLDGLPGTVITLGDNAYPDGAPTDFANCYEPTWGRLRDRTRPAPGNHDYGTAGAAGYFDYFGDAAGPAGRGYYSYDLGAWHIISLNSEIAAGANSQQVKWLRADLAAHPVRCTLAYWHQPRFSSGPHGSNPEYEALWQALYDDGAEVVLNGHDHDYERFAPEKPDGTPDPAHGIREFVVGTGGATLYPFVARAPNSQVRSNATWGILKLTLHAASYDWQFIPVAGRTFTDSGDADCH